MKIPLLFILHLILFFLCRVSSSSVEDFIQCLKNPSTTRIPFSPFYRNLETQILESGWFNQTSAPELIPFPVNQIKPSISRHVYTSQDPDAFAAILQAYIKNSRFNGSTTPKPLAIVTAMCFSHVQSTVVCAKSTGLQLRIRSGGHDFEGMSYVSNDPFVLLDMFGVRAIDIDVEGRTAWAQAGATLGELYYKVAQESGDTLGFPAGICPTVGLGGHFGGGGYGTMMRKYGLSVDHIVDAQVVDANGRILDRESMGEDLFWAIRGGGAASFCVVLSWKINLVPVPRVVTTFNVRRTLEDGLTNIVDQWQRVAPFVDHELFVRAIPSVISTSPGKKTVAVDFIALYLGDAEALLRVVNRRFPLLSLRESDIEAMSWAQSTLFWNDANVSTTAPEALLERPVSSDSYNKRRSDYVIEPIPRHGLELIWRKLIELENISMQWNPYGGKMGEIAENATPFPHRAGNLFKVQYHTVWHDDQDSKGERLHSDQLIELEERYMGATNELYETLTPYVSRGPRAAFLNYRDAELGTNEGGGIGFALAAYFKGNAKRLLEVKAKVDPENFFRYEQSIPLLNTGRASEE